MRSQGVERLQGVGQDAPLAHKSCASANAVSQKKPQRVPRWSVQQDALPPMRVSAVQILYAFEQDQGHKADEDDAADDIAFLHALSAPAVTGEIPSPVRLF